MLYTFGMSVFFLNELLYIEKSNITIEKCSVDQTSQKHLKHSVYVETITTDPLVFHISEPVRISVRANGIDVSSNKLADSWLTIYMLQDSSICFLPDYETSKRMKLKSEYIHQKLQERMNEHSQ